MFVRGIAATPQVLRVPDIYRITHEFPPSVKPRPRVIQIVQTCCKVNTASLPDLTVRFRVFIMVARTLRSDLCVAIALVAKWFELWIISYKMVEDTGKDRSGIGSGSVDNGFANYFEQYYVHPRCGSPWQKRHVPGRKKSASFADSGRCNGLY